VASLPKLQLGPVIHWDGGPAEAAMMEMDRPVVVGSIGEDAMLSIDLPVPEVDEGRPFVAVFGCGGVGEVNVSAPEATFSVSELALVRMADEEYVGDVQAFSSPENGAAWLKARGSGDTPQELGARYRLMYVSEPVSINGTCSTEFWVDGGAGPAVMQVEEYDVDLDSGWQLLKTFTRDTVTSNLGVTFPLDSFLQGVPLDADEVS
jgi:hypothetical protein